MVGSDSLNSSPSPSPSPAEEKLQPKQWGVTKPLSHAGPTDVDIQRNRELEKVRCVMVVALLLELYITQLLIVFWVLTRWSFFVVGF